MARLRAATAADAAAIRTLVRGERRMNPTGLDWRRFVVAEQAGAVVGAVQLRPAGRGARELGSLVVRADRRGRGLARRLVEAAMARADGRVLVITAARHAGFYARWGFRRVAPWRAPRRVALHWAVGQAATLLRLLEGRGPRRMAVLERPAGGDRPAPPPRALPGGPAAP